MKRQHRFMKKVVACMLTLCLCMPAQFTTKTSAADINNIGAPNYRVQKNASKTDAFVYAYNVLDYGADNTGNNDNTQIFQKLIDHTADLGGGIIYVPSGRYKITGSLRIKKGVTLRGDWTKPKAGQSLTGGTILMAYVGRGKGESSTPFMETEVEVGVMDMTIWYPEQNPNNIVEYSPTIRLGCNGYFGNEYANIKNVTLVNSYIGIWWNQSNGGASPVINGVYGTPLKKGIEIDCIADVGRIDNVSFSPDYWSGSGLANAPEKGSPFERWIYDNGIGIVMRRNDWSYACYINIEGYHVGYNTKVSTEGNGATPNGHHYKFKLKNCNIGILFETSNYVGILFNDVTAYNCETGFQVNGGTTDTIQFAKSKFTCSKYAINVDKASTTKVLLYDSTVEKGVVNMDGGTLMSTATAYNNKAPQIVIGSLGRVSLAGNTFKNEREIRNNSIYQSDLENGSVNVKSVPDFDDEKSQYQSHMPKKLDLYVVTNSPYNADNNRNHGGGNDCTNAIQSALNDASANGGGIVFLPAGHYRINGSLLIPSNVELRGATDLSTVPHGSGAILEAYGFKGNAKGTPLIRISENAGVRGIIVNYPEQTYQLDGNGEFHPVDYPATMQGMGSNIYVINTGIRAATYGLDLDTYRCDNHYVEFLAGHVNKVCVKVGNGSSNGTINNLMFNTIIYGCGQEYPKFGGFPNSPNTPAGVSNGPVYDQQLRELEFLIVGDTTNQHLYNCFPYGAYIGTKLISEGNGGPQNLSSMGLGIDGSRKSLYFGSGLTGEMDFVDNQIVSLNNDQPITRYFETEGNSNFTANFYNTDLWGYPEKAVVMNAGSGTLNLYTANFQQRGYNGALTVGEGSKVNLITSSFNTNNAAFSSGSSRVSVINTVADYTRNEANAFAENKANFSTAVAVDGNSPAMAKINRSGWVASSNVNNYMAAQSLDGDLNSQWNSSWQAPGQWYQVDMGSIQQFDTIVTTLGNTADSPGDYKVLLSNDGSNWRQVAAGQNQNIYEVGPQQARYVRIEQNSSAGKFWAIYEFYVLNSETYDVGGGEIIEPEPTTEEQTTEEITTEKETTTEAETTTASQQYKETIYGVENATVTVAELFDTAAAYHGKNVGNLHLEGASFTISSVNGGLKGGIATLLVHYASNEDNSRLGLSVNNGAQFALNFPSTGGWEAYTGTISTEINLAPGNGNTLHFTGGAGGVNVDYIAICLQNSEEEETMGQNGIVSNQLKIEGYQISYTLKGLRVISSVDEEIDGKRVVKAGNIYGLFSYGATAEDLVLGASHPYVANFEYTSDGILSPMPGMAEDTTYHSMTMIKNGTSVKAYTAEYGVRAYAILEDGSVRYSSVKTYSIYKVAAYLYENNLMSNNAGHEYLYRDILLKVNPNYKEIDYDWGNEIVKF